MTIPSGMVPNGDRTVDIILLQIEPRIVALTRCFAYSDLSDWERDEIVQLVWIKLARALSETHITNLSAYVRTTVRNEIISYLRQRKSCLSLLVSEDGDVYGGELLISLSQGMGDPQIEIEQEATLLELLNQLVEAILMLPTVQRRAIICSLRERMDDPSLLIDAFMRYHMDITSIVWPTDRKERQRLQASCSVARRTLARRLHIDLNQYEHRRATCNSRSSARTAMRGETMPLIAV